MTKHKVKYVKIKVVPYQCCPICNGLGYVPSVGLSTTVTNICTVCNGMKIIPMHITKE